MLTSTLNANITDVSYKLRRQSGIIAALQLVIITSIMNSPADTVEDTQDTTAVSAETGSPVQPLNVIASKH